MQMPQTWGAQERGGQSSSNAQRMSCGRDLKTNSAPLPLPVRNSALPFQPALTGKLLTTGPLSPLLRTPFRREQAMKPEKLAKTAHFKKSVLGAAIKKHTCRSRAQDKSTETKGRPLALKKTTKTKTTPSGPEI